MPKNTAEYNVQPELPGLEEMKQELEAIRATPEYSTAWYHTEKAAAALADTAGILEKLSAGRGAEYINQQLESPSQEPSGDPGVALYRLRLSREDPAVADASQLVTSVEAGHQARFGKALLTSIDIDQLEFKTREMAIREITIAQMAETEEFKPDNIYNKTTDATYILRTELADEFIKILQDDYRYFNPANQYDGAQDQGNTRDAAHYWREMAKIMEALNPDTDQIEARWATNESPAMVGFSKAIGSVVDGTIPTDPNLNADQLFMNRTKGSATHPDMEPVRNFLYSMAEYNLAVGEGLADSEDRYDLGMGNRMQHLAQQAHALARSLEEKTGPTGSSKT